MMEPECKVLVLKFLIPYSAFSLIEELNNLTEAEPDKQIPFVLLLSISQSVIIT